jgi:hypothetical protein
MGHSTIVPPRKYAGPQEQVKPGPVPVAVCEFCVGDPRQSSKTKRIFERENQA